jgi:hypothetical protein
MGRKKQNWRNMTKEKLDESFFLNERNGYGKRLICLQFVLSLQITLGLSTPVNAPARKVFISSGYQLVFAVPTNATQWHTLPDIIGKREISNKTLRNIYLPLESLLEKYGFDGRTCVLRSICETAHSPFKHEETNFLEEVVHSVLT